MSASRSQIGQACHDALGAASAFLLIKEDLKAHNLFTYFETIEVVA